MDLETENRQLRLEILNLKADLAKERDGRVQDKVRTMVKESVVKSGALPTAVTDLVERVMRMGDWRINKAGNVVLMQGGLEALSKVTSETVTPSVAVRDVKSEVPNYFGEQPQSGTAAKDGPNPFAKGANFSMTRQGELVLENPQLAQKLAAAAGVTLKL